MEILNLSKNLKKYIVARGYEGKFWFWGTWDDINKAYQVAEDVQGEVFNISDVKVPA